MFDFIIVYLKSKDFKEGLKNEVIPTICEVFILFIIALLNMWLLFYR